MLFVLCIIATQNVNFEIIIKFRHLKTIKLPEYSLFSREEDACDTRKWNEAINRRLLNFAVPRKWDVKEMRGMSENINPNHTVKQMKNHKKLVSYSMKSITSMTTAGLQLSSMTHWSHIYSHRGLIGHSVLRNIICIDARLDGALLR